MRRPEALRHWLPASTVRTLASPFKLVNANIGKGRPCVHAACTNPVQPWLEPYRAWARDRHGWNWAKIVVGHDGMVSTLAN